MEKDLFNNLLYLSKEDIALIKKSYQIAKKAHILQKRKSGEPYITHPLAVAEILAKMQMDSNCIAAALLHDVVEDCDISMEEIAQQTNQEIAKIVDGVTKIDNLQQENPSIKQAHNFQKMALAMSDDVRVIVVKLADRLHNMRTLGNMPLQKRKYISKETQEIYIGMARRLGMIELTEELNDLSFLHQYPMRHKLLSRAVNKANIQNQDYVHIVKQAIANKLKELNIDCDINGRAKSPASIYNKMRGNYDKNQKEDHNQTQFKSFYKIMDIHGFRVVVNSVDNCYRTLGALHQLYRPVPKRFKDYIANGKPNGYQSLHTTLLGPKKYPIEIQIRTKSMHKYNEHGIAGHSLYKNTTDSFALKQKNWLSKIKELQQNSSDPADFLNMLKQDFYEQEVYIFTPKHEIIALKKGATVLDFAYSLHTNIGDHTSKCKIDNKISPITTTLKNGQMVKIITDKNITVETKWLRHVVTSKALSCIKNALRRSVEKKQPTLHQVINFRKIGKSIIRSQIEILDFMRIDDKTIYQAALAMGYSVNDVFDAIGEAKVSPLALMYHMYINNHQPKVQLGNKHRAEIAKCCNPLPNENIMATLGNNGTLIHSEKCRNAIKLAKINEAIPLKWAENAIDETPKYTTKLQVLVCLVDKGIFTKIANIATKNQAIIQELLTTDAEKSESTLSIKMSVKSLQHALEIMQAIKKHPNSLSIGRH